MTTLIQCRVNGEELSCEPSTSVADLLTRMQLSPRNVAVEVNLEIVPRALHAERKLQPGDSVEIVSFVGGG